MDHFLSMYKHEQNKIVEKSYKKILSLHFLKDKTIIGLKIIVFRTEVLRIKLNKKKVELFFYI